MVLGCNYSRGGVNITRTRHDVTFTYAAYLIGGTSFPQSVINNIHI